MKNETYVIEFNDGVGGKFCDDQMVRKSLLTGLLPNSNITVNDNKSLTYVNPPYNMYDIIRLYDFNSTHKICINMKANLSAGIGYELQTGVPKEIINFMKRPNNNFGEDFTDIMVKGVIDYLNVGRMALEVVKVGSKRSLYHAFAHEIRTVQEGKSSRIKEFIQLNTLNEGVKYSKYTYDSTKSGSYLLVMDNYNPSSHFYGIPDWVSALKSIIGNDTIATYMLNFFENNARPDYFLIISGTTLTPEQKSTIENNLKSAKGIDNAHRLVTLVLSNPQAKVEIKEMSKVVDENFRNTKIDNRDEIAQIHGVPPKILGISSAGSLGSGNEAIGALKIFIECVIKPLRTKVEEFMNMFLQHEFNFSEKIFTFKEISLVNEKDLAIILKTYVGEGLMSVNEARKEMGKKSLEGSEYDEVKPRQYNESLEINPDDMANLDPTKDITQTNE